MKFIEKVSLFSIIILVLSLLLCLLVFGWLEISNIYYVFKYLVSTPIATNITLGTAILLMLLAIKCIFFPAYNKEKETRTEGILLENESGKLLISIETIENLVKGVLVGFENVKSTNCRVKLDKQVNNVVIDLNLVVSSDTIIKDLSTNIQNRIKEVIKTTTEIEVKQINIKIKNIETQKSAN